MQLFERPWVMYVHYLLFRILLRTRGSSYFTAWAFIVAYLFAGQCEKPPSRVSEQVEAPVFFCVFNLMPDLER